MLTGHVSFPLPFLSIKIGLNLFIDLKLSLLSNLHVKVHVPILMHVKKVIIITKLIRRLASRLRLHRHLLVDMYKQGSYRRKHCRRDRKLAKTYHL